MMVYILTFSSGKKYVGQTQRSIKTRMTAHRTRQRENTTSPLYAEWEAFGAPDVRILEECSTLEALHECEKKWIESENTIWPNGLNFAVGGLSSASEHSEAARKISEAAKGRKYSDETKRKVSEASKKHWENPEYRAKVLAGVHASNTPEKLAKNAEHLAMLRAKRKESGWVLPEAAREKLRNVVVSEETRKKMSESAKNRRRGPQSQETKDKIAAKTAAHWATKRSVKTEVST